jgi:hypothetical protein
MVYTFSWMTSLMNGNSCWFLRHVLLWTSNLIPVAFVVFTNESVGPRCGGVTTARLVDHLLLALRGDCGRFNPNTSCSQVAPRNITFWIRSSNYFQKIQVNTFLGSAVCLITFRKLDLLLSSGEWRKTRTLLGPMVLVNSF